MEELYKNINENIKYFEKIKFQNFLILFCLGLVLVIIILLFRKELKKWTTVLIVSCSIFLIGLGIFFNKYFEKKEELVKEEYTENLINYSKDIQKLDLEIDNLFLNLASLTKIANNQDSLYIANSYIHNKNIKFDNLDYFVTKKADYYSINYFIALDGEAYYSDLVVTIEETEDNKASIKLNSTEDKGTILDGVLYLPKEVKKELL